MKLLEERIRRDGRIREKGTILKVDSFLNHQMDLALFNEMGKEFFRLFGNEGVTKLLTVEASGIGIACVAGQYFNVPVVFAKKSKTKNIGGSVYTAPVESFTHGGVYEVMVAKEFLLRSDRVLLIDDFLANGAALEGLLSIVEQAGPRRWGPGSALRKPFSPEGTAFDPRVCE